MRYNFYIPVCITLVRGPGPIYSIPLIKFKNVFPVKRPGKSGANIPSVRGTPDAIDNNIAFYKIETIPGTQRESPVIFEFKLLRVVAEIKNTPEAINIDRSCYLYSLVINGPFTNDGMISEIHAGIKTITYKTFRIIFIIPGSE